MRSSRASLAEVARSAGFADQHHLARVFRRTIGVQIRPSIRTGDRAGVTGGRLRSPSPRTQLSGSAPKIGRGRSAARRCHDGAIRGRTPCTRWTSSHAEASEFSGGESLECFRVRFGGRLLISGSRRLNPGQTRRQAGSSDLKKSEYPGRRSTRFRLRGGCISCRAMPRSAHRGFVKPRDLRGLGQLITQRSLVQIQPPQGVTAHAVAPLGFQPNGRSFG